MENKPNLGHLIHGYSERDAVHIAIAPVVAMEDVARGAYLKLVPGTTNRVVRAKTPMEVIGIVDPFLPTGALRGEQFWMLLNPNTITGLRHHWEHRSFDEQEANPCSDSELWLREFSAEWGFDYEQMIASALGQGDSYIVAHGSDLHGPSELGDDYDRFWKCIEDVTGQKISSAQRASVGWSCSC